MVSISKLRQLGDQFLPLQPRQALKPHVENGLGLYLVDPQQVLEAFVGLLTGFGCTDEGDRLVQHVQGLYQTVQDVEPLLGLPQLEPHPAGDDHAPVHDVVHDDVLETQEGGLVVHQGEVDDTVGYLHLGLLHQVLQDDVGDRILVQLDDDPHTAPVGLVPEIGYARYGLVLDQIGDALDEFRLVDLVGKLVDYDGILGLPFLDVGLGPYLYPSSSGGVCLHYAGYAVHYASGREIGPTDELHELFDGGVRIVYGEHYGVAHLPEVVGRHLGGHTDGDTVGTVHEEVGELRREYGGLLQGAVEVVHEVDGVLVQIQEEVGRHLRQTGLGVTHGGRGVPVHGTEVTLSVHERIPQGEGLPHTDHGLVCGGISVGMVLSEDLSDDGRGLLKVRPSSCMANMIFLWTGFNPSRTSGSALLTMTDME